MLGIDLGWGGNFVPFLYIIIITHHHIYEDRVRMEGWKEGGLIKMAS